MADQQSAIRRLAAAILRWAVRVWPEESREWGCALEAELGAIDAPWDALRWAIGGVMLLAKARWSEFLDWLRRPLGVAPGSTSDALPLQTTSAPRMPRGVIAVLLLAALAVLLAPEAREDLREVAASWNLPGQGWTQRELDAMAREAERRGDAETLAFAAMRLPYSAENARRIELAATLDPKLTGVLVNVRERSSKFTVADEHIARLRSWDPGNAFVELLAAERAAAQTEKKWEETHPVASFWSAPGRIAELTTNVEWLTAMQRAFAAPRYDSYVQRRYQLDRSVMQQHGLRAPFALTMTRHVVPSAGNMVVYHRDLILKRGAEAEGKGDRRAAEEAYRTVLAFGERMQTGTPSDLDGAIGSGIERQAIAKLQPLLVATGRADEAAKLAAAAEARYRAIERRFKPPTWEQEKSALWSALAVHLSAGMAVLTGVLSLIAVAVLVVRRRGGRIMRTLADTGPVVFLASAVTLLVVYRPIAKAIAETMAAQNSFASRIENYSQSLIYMRIHFLPWTGRLFVISLWVQMVAWVAATVLLSAFALALYRRIVRHRAATPLA